MIRRILALALLAALVLPAGAEVRVKSLSVTATSQTYVLPVPSNAIMVCNLGANEAYVRLFDETDTTAAATTANILIPAGAATAPVCKSYTKTSTQPGRFAAISAICDTAETATVTIESM